MRICIPTIGKLGLREAVNEHFGSAPYFTIVDLETNAVEIVENQNQHHSHGQCHPMGALTGQEINAVVCGGMGRRAVELLNTAGIKVFLGNKATVSELLVEYQKGNLNELRADQACAGHGCH